MLDSQNWCIRRFVPNLLGVAGVAGTLLLALPIPGIAGYTPPPNPTPPGGGRGVTARRGRGCSEVANGVQLTTLAPQHHTGQTVSAYPTLVWFVPTDKALVGELQIFERTETNDFREVLETPYAFTSTQGFMSFTLPETAEGLSADTEYFWHVLLQCENAQALDEIDLHRSRIEVVDVERLPEPLASEPVKRSAQLAEAGLWYDALAAVSEPRQDIEADAYRDELLLDLAELESVEDESSDSEIDPLPDNSEDDLLTSSETLRRIARGAD